MYLTTFPVELLFSRKAKARFYNRCCSNSYADVRKANFLNSNKILNAVNFIYSITVSIPSGMISLFRRKLSTVVNSIYYSGCRSNFKVFKHYAHFISRCLLLLSSSLLFHPKRSQISLKNGRGGRESMFKLFQGYCKQSLRPLIYYNRSVWVHVGKNIIFFWK